MEAIKADKSLKDLPLVRQGRLSVQPLSKAQFDRILKLSGTSLT
ncbi:MAG TPA: EVE domain-containing protein [Verrucomicrobiae bacterium]|nr:EVE domain-containing protein [Verrucomicrobiae bacterium]